MDLVRLDWFLSCHGMFGMCDIIRSHFGAFGIYGQRDQNSHSECCKLLSVVHFSDIGVDFAGTPSCQASCATVGRLKMDGTRK